MKKALRVFSFFLTIVLLCASMSSCMIVYGDVTYIKLDTGEYIALTYKDMQYDCVGDWLSLKTTKDDIKLGGTYSFPFAMGIYSNTTEDPFCIWESRNSIDFSFDIYLKEDYDLSKALFYIDETDVELVFFDMIEIGDSNLEPDDYLSGYQIKLCLKDFPRLAIEDRIYCSDGFYYFIESGTRWILTDAFVSLLQENRLIPQ